MKDKKNANFFQMLEGLGNFTIVFALVCVAAYAVWFIIYNRGISDDPAIWGTFGDYIGGIVGTVIAFSVFLATLKIIQLQKEAMDLQKQELEETRKELKKSSNAQELQAILLQQQYFDNTFFYWLERLKEQVDLSDEKIKLTGCGGIFSTENIGIKLYPILNRIYNNLNKYKLDDESKKEYSNIIRSYLTEKVLKFIFEDCNEDIKHIVEQYALFKNLEYTYCENCESKKKDGERSYEECFRYYKISAFEGNKGLMSYRISLEKNPEELTVYTEHSDI